MIQEQIRKTHKKLGIKQLLKRLFFITLGAAFVSVGLELFLVPNKIIDGGIVGISIIFSYLINLPLGIFTFLLNLPFLFVGYRQIGKTFAISTLVAVGLMSFGTSLLHPIPVFTNDLLLASVFGGIILGMGVGLIIRYGGSLDGTEIVAILLNRKLPFSVGEIVMFFNIFILASAGFVFGWDKAMYSLIAYYVAFKMIDLTIEGFEESKAVWIISDNPNEIADAILARLGRGVTYLYGQGAYTEEEKKVIYCVVTRLETSKLKSIVEEIDPGSFVSIGNIHETMGGRFKKRAIH
ncbi:membrane protein [Collibacillus ludicampi]|uniref:Membrane protein n=1 Tax=Collibacillus ludicampi TaxID=2771369 RepID=A0AAV4LG34_9BACL|nr:YitT family protein [Collibacillus ludicampi]GIM46801.1 membrane protein [Collibacillus ludicampi]